MKKILIVGAGSYIGTSFEQYVSRWQGAYSVDTADTKDGSWRDVDMSGYDAVLHVAGIAHVKETRDNAELYYKVNRDLPIEVAKKARESGVGQFVFLSSMSVYSAESGNVDADTPLAPVGNYGRSKLEAEQGLLPLESENFKIAFIRPPMIYGKGCRGNYPLLVKIALKLPVFPDVDNKRSMLYIDNLCEFIRLVIDREERGVFFPQNSEYVNTTYMAEQICMAHGKRFRKTKIFNWTFSIVSLVTGKIKKAFGTLTYDMSMSEYDVDYNVVSFEDSIKNTEDGR